MSQLTCKNLYQTANPVAKSDQFAWKSLGERVQLLTSCPAPGLILPNAGMEEEAGCGILASGFMSKSQVNALRKVYIFKMQSEMYVTSYLEVLSSWHVIATIVLMAVNAPKVPTWDQNILGLAVGNDSCL